MAAAAVALFAVGLWLGWKYLGVFVVGFGWFGHRQREGGGRKGGRSRRWFRWRHRAAGELLIGGDGVRISGRARARYVPWSEVSEVGVDPRDLERLVVRQSRGRPIAVRLRDASLDAADACREALAAYRAAAPPEVPAELARGAETERAWLDRVAGLLGRDTYRRAGPPIERVLAVAESPRAPASARLAAITALAAGAPDLRARLRAACAQIADPSLAAAAASACAEPASPSPPDTA